MAQTEDKPATKGRILADDQWHQVGDRLLRRRRRLEWSQRELARRAGVRHDRLSRIEHGVVTPTLIEAIGLSQSFDMSLDELVFGIPTVRGAAEGQAWHEEIVQLGRHLVVVLQILLLSLHAGTSSTSEEERP